MQIVIAKVEMTGLRATGRTVTRELNTFPELVAAPEAKGCMWLNDGASEDVRKAKDAMTKEGYTVYTFPSTEKDPIGKAKAAALEAFKKCKACRLGVVPDWNQCKTVLRAKCSRCGKRRLCCTFDHVGPVCGGCHT